MRCPHDGANVLGHFTAIARSQREQGRVCSAGALTHDGDSGPMDVELVGVRVYPTQRRIIVFDRAALLCLGRKPIVDRRNETIELDRPILAVRRRPCGSPGDIAATLGMHDRGAQSTGLWIDPIDRNVRAFAWYGNALFDDRNIRPKRDLPGSVRGLILNFSLQWFLSTTEAVW